MFYQPDFIMYLWLAPVFVIFLLPFLLTPAEKLYEKLMAARAGAGEAVQPAEGYSQPVVADKREQTRMEVDGIIAHVTDGVNYCAGSVNDISRDGIHLANTSASLNYEADQLGVLLTGKGKSFQMKVRPKWNQPDGHRQSIGARIEDSPWNWEEFKEHVENTQPVA